MVRGIGAPIRSAGPVLALVALLVVAGGLLAAVPVLPSGGPTGRGAAGGNAAVLASEGRGELSRAAARPLPSVANLSYACTTLRSRFAALYPGPALPPIVAGGLPGSCPIGYDVAGLGLRSDAPLAAARLELNLALPTASGGAARGVLALQVGLWVAGVPCSAGGAAYASVDLVPPFGAGAATNLSEWSVWAPTYDLVPAGGCDPACENQTALFSLNGSARNYCEDDPMVSGPLASLGPLGELPSGSNVTLTFVGAAGSTEPLAVYVNDTAAPSDALAWNYSATATVSGRPLVPLTNASGSAAFWGIGPSPSLAYLLCPTPAPVDVSGASACESYDGPVVNGSAFPRLLGADAFNATSGLYDAPYPLVAPFSSSGGCSGATGVAPCQGFRTGGGTGSYPFFSLTAADGTAAWSFGGAGPFTLLDLGGAAQFNASGASAPPALGAAISGFRTAASAGALNFTARVSGLAGNAAVDLSVYFCTTGTTASVSVTPAVKDAGPTNGSTDTNFSAKLTLSGGERGTLYYWWTDRTDGGGALRSATRSYTIFAGARACVYPKPASPEFGSANVTAIADGYRLDFLENDSAVTNYTLTLQPATGGAPLTRNLSSSGPEELLVGAAGAAYNLTLRASDVTGQISNATTTFEAPATLSPLLSAIATEASGSLWANAAAPWVNVTVTGGVAPYEFVVGLGDGSSVVATRPAPYWNVTDDLTGYDGVAWVVATVTDAAGDAAAADPVPISVLAGPLGVNQTLSAGAYAVAASWTPPASPAGAVTGYSVLYTNDSATAATLTGFGPDNRSAVGAFVWNTTATALTIPDLSPSTRYYLLVVAWDAAGIGLLPEGWLSAPSVTTSNLSAGPIAVTPAGGAAPLTVSVSDEFTLGTNGSLIGAEYSFGDQGSATANLSENLSGSLAVYWANASWTFAASGLELVALHLTDAYGDTEIPMVYVYVGPAAPPSAVARVTSGTAVVGEPVSFEGIAAGGTGSYSYNWSFGDGGTSTDVSPAHTYFAPGNYTAVLEVTDTGDGAIAYAEANVTVFALPTAAIELSEVGTTGDDLAFRAVATGGVGGLSYSWTFGDGDVATGASVDHVYLQPGSYTVNLTVVDALRHAASASIVVVVPTVASTAPSSSPGISGPELAAYALLAALAVALLIGLLYYRSRALDAGPAPEELRRPPPVRPPTPPDPPNPS